MTCLWAEDIANNNQNMKAFGFMEGRVHTTLTKSLTETLKFIDSAEFRNVDSVVLDIDLQIGHGDWKTQLKDVLTEEECGRLSLSENKKDLKLNAGFYIYLKLLTKGFPKKRICFLTAHISEDHDDILKNVIQYIQSIPLISSRTADIENKIRELASSEYGESDLINKLKEYLAKNNKKDMIKTLTDHLEENKQKPIDEIENKQDVIIKSDLINELKEYLAKNNIKGMIKILTDLLEKNKEDANIKTENMQTHDAWKENFRKIKIEAPEGYDKFSQDGRFKEWLTQQRDEYIYLRRCLNYACDILIDRLKNCKDEDITFSNFVDNNNDGIYTIDYFIKKIDLIKRLLPLDPYSGRDFLDKNLNDTLYVQLVKHLVHDFEDVKGYVESKDNKYDKSLIDERYAYVAVLKMLRNWVSHSKLKSFTASEVALYFMLAIRIYIKIPEILLEYEGFIFDMIKDLKNSEPVDQKKLKDIIDSNEVERMLKESLKKITNVKRNEKMNTINMYKLLHNLGYDQNEGVKTSYLSILLWHSLFKMEIEIDFDKESISIKPKIHKELRIKCTESRNFIFNLLSVTFEEIKK